MQKKLRDLKIGTYDNIETADETTSIITALKKFVERRVSALPLVDNEGRLVDIYAKFDVIVSKKKCLINNSTIYCLPISESGRRENLQRSGCLAAQGQRTSQRMV